MSNDHVHSFPFFEVAVTLKNGASRYYAAVKEIKIDDFNDSLDRILELSLFDGCIYTISLDAVSRVRVFPFSEHPEILYIDGGK